MQQYNYTPSNPLSGFISTLAIAAGMIVVPLFMPFGISIGRMRILGPMAVTIIFVGGGILLLLFTLRDIAHARKLAAEGAKITVDGDKITVPVVRKGAIVEESFLLSDVKRVKYDEEEREFDISLDGNSYTLRTNFFDDDEKFESFRTLFR